MKTIKVKYLAPTNTKPTRVKAMDSDGNQVTLCRDSLENKLIDLGLMSNSGQVAKLAAIELCEKMGWTSGMWANHAELIGGCFDNDYYFNFAESNLGEFRQA